MTIHRDDDSGLLAARRAHLRLGLRPLHVVLVLELAFALAAGTCEATTNATANAGSDPLQAPDCRDAIASLQSKEGAADAGVRSGDATTTNDAAVAAAIARFGRVDVLVNNAGFGYLGAVEEGEDAAVRALFDTNVFGVVDMTKAVLPAMRAQQGGLIVNVSSIGGLVSSAGTGYYHASKYAP